MFKSFDFCLPTNPTVPSGPDWLDEVKYDGYRLRLERDGDRVGLITVVATTGPPFWNERAKSEQSLSRLDFYKRLSRCLISVNALRRSRAILFHNKGVER